MLVLGMGMSGRGAAHLLKDKGAKVTIGEIKKDKEKRREATTFSREGIKVVLGPHPLNLLWNQELIIVSPGIPLDIPLLQKARGMNIPIIGELELSSRFIKNTSLIAITGTNGKTTTTLLVGKILKKAYKNVRIAGNIGTPLSNGVKEKKQIVVVEVSSFQLETINSFSPRVSCILNITPDHLDRHLDLKEYIELKSRIFLNQKKEDFTVLNRDDPRLYLLSRKPKSKVIFFSQKEELKEGVFLKKNQIIRRFNGEEEIIKRDEIPLPGPHNLENILGAISICSIYNIEKEIIREVLIHFKGLPHREEYVDEIKGVRFINDSKATNEDAVKKCLQSLKNPVILIMGGKNKGADFSSIRDEVKKR
ncbi:MAG: UDP-N-acetylmuramoyl-L-alanine--D-glutamate ligase, partial [Candidatus Aerophobetes bacterium]|nr:UDP-N-acetylmuramoyl-L-alanine--D-glutamate ligase [Candidatus Aerophobetes bacterium]